MFFLLLMVLWTGLERQRYGWAWIAAVLLPLTRAVGLFCLLPIAWHLMTRRPLGWMRRWGAERWDPPETSTAASGPVNPAGFLPYSLLLAPVAGWAFYLALMWRWTGDPAGHERHLHHFHALRVGCLSALHRLGCIPREAHGALDAAPGTCGQRGASPVVALAICEFPVGGMNGQLGFPLIPKDAT